MLLPPAPAGAAAKNAKLVATLVLYSPGRTPRLRLRHRPSRLEADGLKKFVSGNVPGLRLGPAQALEEGSGRHAQATQPQPLARSKTLYPSYLCFLFDTVSPISGSGIHTAFAARTPAGIQKKT